MLNHLKKKILKSHLRPLEVTFEGTPIGINPHVFPILCSV